MTAIVWAFAAIGAASVFSSVAVAVLALVITARERREDRRRETAYEAAARRGDPRWWTAA